MRHRERYIATQILVLGSLLLGIFAVSARASVAVLVEEPYGTLGGMTPSGHAAVYLDHICAASPTELRPCHEGEMGAVISRYDGIGHYDWIAMPLVAYLYAVDSTDQIPLTANVETEWELRDNYRRTYLEGIAPDSADGSRPKGNWYEVVGSAYDRTLYGFQVKTTSEQDAALISRFNDRPNTEHYNGFYRNCADFVRVTVNQYYPKAIRRNFIADIGFTSPKQLAHGLTKYADKHPEAGLTTFVVHQVPGSIARSHEPKCFVESFLKSARYVVPLTIFEPYVTAGMAAAYVANGRFSMPKNAPSLMAEKLEGLPRIEDSAIPAPPPLMPAGTMMMATVKSVSLSLPPAR